MNPMVILKLLDLAMIAFAAYQSNKTQQQLNSPILDRLATIRKKVLIGEISPELASAEIEEVTNAVIERRLAAFDSLPKPPGHS
ncbi:MAG: hypothetical protein KJN90_10595 [Gammaproteobacteria bacterium]|nr:hypothetical protein [Gammaproteobacteria bacterium]MBT8438691.1 hypothetical protein [Gammaproteobacteria bacterium]NNK57416.1 hypothetical protein [Desulfofustis sp.]